MPIGSSRFLFALLLDAKWEGDVFFRFVCALILAALVSMTGIVLEKQTLERKRNVTRQYYQLDLLLELHAQSRLRIQKLTSPSLQVAEGGLLPTSTDDVQWAIESYLVSQADDSLSNANADSEAQRASLPSTSPRNSSQPDLPLLRWQHPMAADETDPNRR